MWGWVVTLILGAVILQLIRKRFRRKRHRPDNAGSPGAPTKLTTQEVDGAKLSLSARQEVWELFDATFVKEHDNFDSFDTYLQQRKVLLFRDTTEKKALQGFIILNTEDKTVDGKAIRVVIGDFFALTANYRRTSTPIVSLLKFCVKTKLRNPFKQMYYFFITYSFKSYLSFSRSMGEFYPCHSKRTPAWEKKILDIMGKEMAEGWGHYNPLTCVIEDRNKGTEGRLADLARSFPRDLSTTWVWFAKSNPHFAQGDCLCVLCCISLNNMIAGAKNSLMRALGLGSKRRQPRTLGLSSNKNLGFGMAGAKCDLNESKDVQSYTIQISEEQLDDLDARLDKTRFPDQLVLSPEHKWDYGMDLDYMKQLVEYWRTDYDWQKHEHALNQFHQYTMEIDDINIHFIHMKAKRPNSVPLLLLHGWPGSFYEFYKIIKPLVSPHKFGGVREHSFHVVVPSLPGYGFSDAPISSGYDIKEVAAAMATLMEGLGYKKYVVHGGDWGHLVAAYIADMDPNHCMAVHLNMVAVWEPQSLRIKASFMFDMIFQKWRLTEEERKWLEEVEEFTEKEMGYVQIQQTKPQTIGYALTDSPVGLAAWIIEKFRTWSDCDGNVEKRFTKDELLTNVMIYWWSRSATSSARLYYETHRKDRFGPPNFRVEQPTAIAVYPKEILRPPRRWVERFYNVKRWTPMDYGGHFPALENPQSLINDLRAFFFDDLTLHQTLDFLPKE